MEIWKDIKGLEGKYQISNIGRVRNIIKNIVLKSHVYYGYEKVTLYYKKGYKKVSIHRLVAQAFIPNPENKPEVNHINGIKTDNKVQNLEWNTSSENQKHAVNLGLHKGRKGENHHGSKLTKNDIIEIRFSLNHLSSIEVAKIFNISKGHVNDIRGFRTWKHI